MVYINKNIRFIKIIFIALFLCILVVFAKYIALDSKNIITSPYNKRLSTLDNELKRGTIYDSTGQVLAQSFLSEDGSYVREYPFGVELAHVIGYMDFGKYGVESKYNFNLQTLTDEIAQRFRNVFFHQPLVGDDLILTLSMNLQRKAYEALGSNKGAIVALEPSTGKVLAMVSYPSFDPNTIATHWATLSSDNENSPLINRATQGLYPPGSVFKVVTALSAMGSIDNLDNIGFECSGETIYNHSTIHCFNSNVHGMVNINSAFTVSCNTTFSEFGLECGFLPMKTVAERLLFNSDIQYALGSSVSSFSLSELSDEAEIVQTAIGQGKTLATPLHLALIASAIANNGIMMTPYIVDHSTSYDNKEKNKELPQMLTATMSDEEAHRLTDMMISVVDSGTAKGAKVDGIKIAAKTGTAENSSGEAHGLLIAFAPAENPRIALAIVMENSGGSASCLPAAKTLIQQYLTE